VLWVALCGLAWVVALAPAAAGELVEPAAQAPAPAADLPIARFVVATPDGEALMPLLTRVLEAADVVDPFDPEDDERQLRRIRNSTVDVLATEGYFSPRMTIQADADQRSKYVVRLDPGPRTRVVEVEIALKGAIEQQPERLRELAESWDLAVGQPFRDGQWSTAKTRLLARVKERDYPAARLVDSAADIDADEAQARLRLQIDSGPAFTLGEVRLVKELKRYDRKLVERFNDIAPGERYDAGRLLDFQRRLQSAPYFSSVLVDVDIDPAKPDNVPILLDLTEGRSKRVSTGLGFSTNTGPRVEATYRQVGLFGYPYTLQTGAGYDKTRSVGYADILLPPKPNGALDSLGVLGERTDIQNFVSRRWAAGVARAETTDGQADAQGRNYDTRLSLKLQRETTERRVSALEREEAARIGLPIEGPRTNDTLSLSYSWTRRTVDSITDPRRGDVLTLVGATGIGRTGLSELLSQSFVYGYGRYVRYFPVFDRHQIILRGEVGHVVVDDLGFVPLEFRFRAGGAGSVRGYQYQELGARQGAAVIGADSLVVGSAEYVHWFTNSWGGALFYDVGDADNDLFDVSWAKGYGAGARWRTLAGPLALDVAYGERDKQWRVHFTIAIAF
jgi:translocation and assembly module TamA